MIDLSIKINESQGGHKNTKSISDAGRRNTKEHTYVMYYIYSKICKYGLHIKLQFIDGNHWIQKKAQTLQLLQFIDA